MYIFHEKLEKMDMGGGGVIRQYLGQGQKMNAQHWNMADKSIVKMHKHSQEQFGYVIKGGFSMIIGDERAGTGSPTHNPPLQITELILSGEYDPSRTP